MRFGIGLVEAERKSDIRSTKHNLSSRGTGSVKATSESQVCVFCHTPHNSKAAATPLWNRNLSTATYTNKYDKTWSSSLDADANQGGINDPAGSSKLCLSCHDGTLNIGSVNVLNGQYTSTAVTGLAQAMPTGTDGYTRNLGTDLTNDHPISVSFNDTLAGKDGELRKPSTAPLNTTGAAGTYYNRFNALIGVRTSTSRPLLKLEATAPTKTGNENQIQCATCHDPHITETDSTVGNQKFLRLNRFQGGTQASESGFKVASDIMCLACHAKNNDMADTSTSTTGTGAWAYSAHANPGVADETYSSGAALTNRDFPSALPVWKAACLNCHDTHTVQGAKKLLRDGVISGAAAQEKVCFNCHGNSPIVEKGGIAGGDVPNIEKDFSLTRKMPIGKSPEKHDIGGSFSDKIDCTTSSSQCGKDLIENASNLGTNRHVECSDCHNPHRVIRAQNGLPGTLTLNNTKDTNTRTNSGGGTHKHLEDNSTQHSNLISGVLRGSWGAEPKTYVSNSFYSAVSTWEVKRGDPGGAQSTNLPANPTYVTREYQICLKCHSSYAYGTTPPSLSDSTPAWDGSTLTSPIPSNGLTKYTDQAREFQAPSTHAKEPASVGADGGANGGVAGTYDTNNHRSWHPVIQPTGRKLADRQITSGVPWRQPWSNSSGSYVGTQTMYCTDCHGAATTKTTVIPDASQAWGPHGSGNNFILKGVWNNQTGQDDTGLCFRCHDYNTYARGYTLGQGWSSGVDCGNAGKPGKTGFKGGGWDLHCEHQKRIGARAGNVDKPLQCSWCHVAVPHGWKNKAFLVNLNDVGQELGAALAGLSKEVAISDTTYYTKEPYYLRAKNKIRTFAASGSWADTNCGSSGKTNTNLITSADASFGTNTGATTAANNNTNTGKSWMQNACSNPS